MKEWSITFRVWDEIMLQIDKGASDVAIYSWLKIKNKENLENMKFFIGTLLKNSKGKGKKIYLKDRDVFKRIVKIIDGIFLERKILHAI